MSVAAISVQIDRTPVAYFHLLIAAEFQKAFYIVLVNQPTTQGRRKKGGKPSNI